jgi:hypothetical protein
LLLYAMAGAAARKPELEERVVENDGQGENADESQNDEVDGPSDAAGMLAVPAWTALAGIAVAIMAM